MEDQKCRICGCTDDDCSQCIRITGQPCHWVEEDLCSACADAINNQLKNNDMNFFQQLAVLGNVDLTMRIMQDKTGKLTMNIMPGVGSSSVTPINVTGTPAELDAEFFQSIAPGVKEIAGILTNLAEVKKEVTEKKDKPVTVKQAASSDKKNASDKKKAVKKEEKETPAEPQLF